MKKSVDKVVCHEFVICTLFEYVFMLFRFEKRLLGEIFNTLSDSDIKVGWMQERPASSIFLLVVKSVKPKVISC